MDLSGVPGLWVLCSHVYWETSTDRGLWPVSQEWAMGCCSSTPIGTGQLLTHGKEQDPESLRLFLYNGVFFPVVGFCVDLLSTVGQVKPPENRTLL